MTVTVQASPFVGSFEAKPFSRAGAHMTLAAGTAKSYPVPGDKNQKYRAEFSCASSSNVFIGYNVTATVPSAGTVDTTGQTEAMRPGMARYVFGGDVLSFITPDTNAYPSVSLLAIPNN